jgi:hypothetical protein
MFNPGGLSTVNVAPELTTCPTLLLTTTEYVAARFVCTLKSVRMAFIAFKTPGRFTGQITQMSLMPDGSVFLSGGFAAVQTETNSC